MLSHPAYLAIRGLSEKLSGESGRLVAAVGKGDIGKAIEHYMAMDGLSAEAMTKLADLTRGLGYHGS